ncbi:chloride channel protein [Streptomyces sp. NPDC059989]|uniref:chloride channel protein n=1 Tax=Streptomyces sp. NPDC059989 TaxID=3347026 RepID=UPI003675E39C
MTDQQPPPPPPPQPSPPQPAPGEPQVLRDILLSPGYMRVLLLCALIGIPVSLAAFWFLAGLHALQHALWADLPHALLGRDTPPWWWPLPLLAIAGTVVGLVVARLPGTGGHIPAAGLQPGGATTAALPGVLIAATASLPFGAVLGPEGPLIALGGGLALLLRDISRGPTTPQATALVTVAGSAAGMAAIFGSPLIAAVLLIEVVGLGGPRLFAVMLPALLSSGVGALVFTGFGSWTGLKTGGLSMKLPGPVPSLHAGDIAWTLLIAVLVAAAMQGLVAGGRRTAAYVAPAATARPGHGTRGLVVRTVLCALGAGLCAALYTLLTDHSPVEVASSGQAELPQLVTHAQAWGVGTLIALLLLKGIGYALCLGSLRGGPVFPSLFLGAAVGVLLAPLPGLGFAPAVAAGMAAACTSVLRLPVSCVVLVVLVIGEVSMTPVVILAAVAAFITAELVPLLPLPWRKPAAT